MKSFGKDLWAQFYARAGSEKLPLPVRLGDELMKDLFVRYLIFARLCWEFTFAFSLNPVAIL